MSAEPDASARLHRCCVGKPICFVSVENACSFEKENERIGVRI